MRYYVERASQLGVSIPSLIEGLPSAPRVLRKEQAWYPWDEHATLLERLEAALGQEGATAFGRRAFTHPVTRALRTLAGFFTTPERLYQLGFRWFSGSFYRHIRFHYTAEPGGRLRAVISWGPEYRDCPAFFRMWVSALEATPTMLGLSEARVTLDLGVRSAVFHIHPPPSRRPWLRLASWLHALGRAPRIAAELERHQVSLREAYESLLASREDFQLVLETSPEPVLVLRGLEVLYLNPAAAKVLGGGAVRGTSVLTWIHPDDHAACERLFQPSGGPALEFRVNAPDGRTLTWRAKPGRRLRFEHEEALLIVANDVTDQAALHAQLALNERLIALGTLSAGVAHEINNPLTYVLHSAEALLSPRAKLPDDFEPEEHLRAIQDGARRIQEIVRQLVGFARPSTPGLSPVDVHAVVRTMLRFVQDLLGERGRIELDFAPVPPVLARERELGQVVLNLLLNAVQAIVESGRPSGAVTVMTRQAASGAVELTVSDDGPGVPAHLRTRIFDPFFTTRAKGTGLGLYICHRLVSELGGTLTLLDLPRPGASIRVTLPASTTPVAAEAPAPPVLPRPAPRRMRVLVVDDSRNLLRSLQLLLGDFDTAYASSGEEALRTLEQGEFDAVLCDVMMPGMSGLQVRARTCERSPTYARRFIFMTGGATSAAMEAELESLPNTCLQKPFTQEQLVKALEQL